MGWMSGFGKMFSNLGGDLGSLANRRDTLRQQAIENALRDRQVGTQEEQARIAAEREARLDAAQKADDDRLLAFGLADRFGGREVDDPTLQAIPEAYRSLLTESSPERISGDPKIAGMPDPLTFTPVETNVLAGPDARRFRVTESDATRRAAAANESRQQIAFLRSKQFYDKLGQDRELAELANKLGYDRIKSAWDQHVGRMGLGYAGVDRAYDQMEFERTMEIFKADMRVLAAQDEADPIWALLGQTPPQRERGPRPENPPPSPRRGGGKRPPPAAEQPPTTDPTNPAGLLRPRR